MVSDPSVWSMLGSVFLGGRVEAATGCTSNALTASIERIDRARSWRERERERKEGEWRDRRVGRVGRAVRSGESMLFRCSMVYPTTLEIL